MTPKARRARVVGEGLGSVARITQVGGRDPDNGPPDLLRRDERGRRSGDHRGHQPEFAGGVVAERDLGGEHLGGALTRLGPQPPATHYAFTTLKPIPLQLDGELLTLDAGTAVSVDIVPRALATVS
jgi:hypothetical protein